MRGRWLAAGGTVIALRQISGMKAEKTICPTCYAKEQPSSTEKRPALGYE
jgi:hypothetical protein